MPARKRVKAHQIHKMKKLKHETGQVRRADRRRNLVHSDIPVITLSIIIVPLIGFPQARHVMGSHPPPTNNCALSAGVCVPGDLLKGPEDSLAHANGSSAKVPPPSSVRLLTSPNLYVHVLLQGMKVWSPARGRPYASPPGRGLAPTSHSLSARLPFLQ